MPHELSPQEDLLSWENMHWWYCVTWNSDSMYGIIIVIAWPAALMHANVVICCLLADVTEYTAFAPRWAITFPLLCCSGNPDSSQFQMHSALSSRLLSFKKVSKSLNHWSRMSLEQPFALVTGSDPGCRTESLGCRFINPRTLHPKRHNYFYS